MALHPIPFVTLLLCQIGTPVTQWADLLQVWEDAASRRGGVELTYREFHFVAKPRVLLPSGRLPQSDSDVMPHPPVEFHRRVVYRADPLRWRSDSTGKSWEAILSEVVEKTRVDCWDGNRNVAFDCCEGPPSIHRRPGWISSLSSACVFRCMPQHLPLVLMTQPTATGCSLFDPDQWDPVGSIEPGVDLNGPVLKQRLRSRVSPQITVSVTVEARPPHGLCRYERGGLTVVVEYQDHVTYGRVPSGWRSTQLGLDGTSIANEITVQVEQISLGCQFDESVFRVKIPAGTVVRDASRGEIETFYVKPDGSHREITSSEWSSGFDYDLLATTEPGELRVGQAEQHRVAPRSRWWSWLNAAAIVAAAVAFWIRRRQTKNV